MNKFFEILEKAIITAEREFGAGEGVSKKEKVVNTVNALVDIPVIPEFIEEKVFSLVVDLVVYLFNKYGLFDKA